MGIFTNVIGFGRSKRGKIVTWSMVAFGMLFFIVGIILTSVNAPYVKADSIELKASDMPFEKTTSTNYYALTVTRQTTFITVIPTPSNANSPAEFSTTSPYISFQGKSSCTVPSNGTAILTLERTVSTPGIPGSFYMFHKENEQSDIIITVACGEDIKHIHVRIELKPETVRISAVLEKSPNGNDGTWAPAHEVDPDDFSPIKAYYRVNVKFYIFNELIYWLFNDNGINTTHRGFFDYIDLSPMEYSKIDLFGKSGSSSGFLDIVPAFLDPQNFFTITCDFNNETYAMDHDFVIDIKQ